MYGYTLYCPTIFHRATLLKLMYENSCDIIGLRFEIQFSSHRSLLQGIDREAVQISS